MGSLTMCFLASEAKILATVSLTISTKLSMIGESTPSLMTRSFKEGSKSQPSLVKAIEESRIAITVLSNNYASSSFCLDELSKIIECIEGKGRLVLPIVYDVDPSLVRHQRGSYGEAMARHVERFFKSDKEKLKDNMERLKKWKMALKQAANLSGEHFKLGIKKVSSLDSVRSRLFSYLTMGAE